LTITDKLKAYIKAENITQRELAKRLDIGETEVSRWLRGKHLPSRLMLKEIERQLNIS